jgi:hypothetical protein
VQHGLTPAGGHALLHPADERPLLHLGAGPLERPVLA